MKYRRNSIKKIEEAKFSAFRRTCLQTMVRCSLVSLNKCFSISGDEMQKFYESYAELINSIHYQIDNLDAMETALKDDCGIEFVEDKQTIFQNQQYDAYRRGCNKVTVICALVVLNDLLDMPDDDMQTFYNDYTDRLSRLYSSYNTIDEMENDLKTQCAIEMEGWK